MRELSLNILDIVQNSIKANADLINIFIDDSFSKNTLTIKIEDNGCGMSPEEVEQVTNPFFTSRTTRKVGLGVPLFKMAAEQTDGSFEISSELNVGTKLCAVFNTSHLDMTPLGDINSTVSILIRCNPNIDFLFKHATDNGELKLDTKELREVLGEDVSLDTPDVIAWIEEFLKENSLEIMNKN